MRHHTNYISLYFEFVIVFGSQVLIILSLVGSNEISGFFALLLSLTSDGSPYNGLQQIKNKEIVGQATNIITAKLLKGGIDNNKNSVFSPIGFASILAILGEGAQDETNHDIVTLLKHPEDRAEVRSAYHSVLKHLQGMEPSMTPQFRSWFYIYKNNSVDESFKKLIADEYFVIVRDVEPYDVNEMSLNPPTERTLDEKPSSVDIMDVQLKNGGQPSTNNSKDIVELDSFKLEGGIVDETRIDNQKDASKFDEIVEDRQYVDGAALKDEIKNKVEPTVEALNSVVDDESNAGTTVPSIESKKDAVVEPEKLTLPLKRLEEMEIMHAEESRIGKAVSLVFTLIFSIQIFLL